MKKEQFIPQHKKPVPTPQPRKALPGHAKQDKHPVVKRGEPITNDQLLTKWSAR